MMEKEMETTLARLFRVYENELLSSLEKGPAGSMRSS